MMRARVAALWTLAIAAAGCGDPTLRVEVDVPDGFADDTTKIVVRAYASDDYACDQVEFAEVTTAALQAAFVDEATVGGADDTLSVPREGAKLFVAEGFDAADRRLFAGCEGRGEITEDEVVTIVGHPLATTTITGQQLDSPFARREIDVYAVDAQGNPIDGRAVRWTSYGPNGAFPATGGAESSTQAICTSRGIARVEPADPSTPGPIAAQIFVSWAEALPTPLSGFIGEPVPPTVALDDGFSMQRDAGCVVRREAGEDQVYCLTRSVDVTAPRGIVKLTLSGDTLGYAPSGSTSGNWLVVAPDANGDGDDDLYAVERGAGGVTWRGIAGTPDGGFVPACTGLPTCSFAIQRVVPAPGCGDEPGFAVIGVALSDRQRFIIASLAGEPTGLFDDNLGYPQRMLTLLAAGCVAESTADGIGHQAFASRVEVDVGGGNYEVLNNQVTVLCPDDVLCTAKWVGFGAVGFSGGARPKLLSSEIDLSGNVIVESELAVAQGELVLVERDRTPTIAAATGIGSGDFDDDGEEDLAWTLSFTSDIGEISNRIQLALDGSKRDLPFPGRLTGLSPPKRSAARAQLLLADLDHDGHDDVLTFSDVDASLYRTGVTVPPMAAAGLETACPAPMP